MKKLISALGFPIIGFFDMNLRALTKLIPITAAFALGTLTAAAQNEASTWFIGSINAIGFKASGPEKITPAPSDQVLISSMISDSNGSLLFYTNGISVWDRNHARMPNGYDLSIGHHVSNSQIVPKPGDPNRYFIFTVSGDGWGAPNDAARYAEVDLCLHNGFGDVVPSSKSVPLVSVASRHSAVVRHANGIDYWVAIYKWQSDAVYCYQVTPSGVNLTPVISHTGFYLGFHSNSTGDGGEMKFSSDGRRLGMAVTQYATVEMFRVDPQSGLASNPL